MPRYKIISHAYLTVPEGTVFDKEYNELRLPNGSCWKAYVTIEQNEIEDLTTTDIEAAGGDLEYDGTELIHVRD